MLRPAFKEDIKTKKPNLIEHYENLSRNEFKIATANQDHVQYILLVHRPL